VELLMEVLPILSRLAILWDPDGPGPTVAFKETKAVAQAFKLDLQSLEIRGPNPDLEGAFQAAKKGRRDALIIVGNPTTSRLRKRIMELVTRNRLPSMTSRARWVRAGALMSYAARWTDLYRRAATYVDKILKGAKPADLPVEQPTKFDLVINLKTAKALGLTIPPEILLQATKVIR
jgi:putative ABC transport system substrate-binding protein